MDTLANPRLSLLANLRVLKNFGHTCLLKSLPRHLLDATGCSICSGAAVNCINFWIRTLSPPCSFEGFGVQDLKTFFKSNSIILLPPQLRLGYLVIHHIENLFHSCEKLKIEKKIPVYRDVVFEGRICIVMFKG